MEIFDEWILRSSPDWSVAQSINWAEVGLFSIKASEFESLSVKLACTLTCADAAIPDNLFLSISDEREYSIAFTIIQKIYD